MSDDLAVTFGPSNIPSSSEYIKNTNFLERRDAVYEYEKRRTNTSYPLEQLVFVTMLYGEDVVLKRFENVDPEWKKKKPGIEEFFVRKDDIHNDMNEFPQMFNKWSCDCIEKVHTEMEKIKDDIWFVYISRLDRRDQLCDGCKNIQRCIMEKKD